MIDGLTYGNVSMKCANGLSDLICNSFKSIITQVAEFSPSDSVVQAELNMKEGLYNANIQIHSQELNITTEKSAESVVSLLGSMKHDLMEQIATWKKIRTVEIHSA